MIAFIPGDGALHRAHPFATLSVGASTLVSALVLPGPQGPVALMLGVAVLAWVEGVGTVIRTVVLVVAPFWIFLTLIHGVIRGDPVAAWTLAARLTSIVGGFGVVVASTHPSRLVDALVARRVPFAATYLLTATLQAIPRMRSRAAGILEAQQCRGLRIRGRVGGRIRALVPLSVPLILSALTEVEERAIALDTRGANPSTVRTPLDPPRLRPVDIAIGLMGLLLVAAAVTWRVRG